MNPDDVIDIKRRGEKIASGFHDGTDWWWRVGKELSEHDLSPAGARQAVEMAGFVLERSDRTIRRIRLVYERAREAGLTSEDVRGCPRRFVRRCAKLHNDGPLSKAESKALVRYRASHIGAEARMAERLENDPKEFAKQVLANE